MRTLAPISRVFVRSDAPATSREAAASAAPSAGTRALAVLEFLKDCGERGATDFEIDEALPGEETYRPRRVGLKDKGFVKDSGTTRKSPRGRRATVWVVTEKA